MLIFFEQAQGKAERGNSLDKTDMEAGHNGISRSRRIGKLRDYSGAERLHRGLDRHYKL